ncbi:hypothetical protein AX16_002242 [Volvariella volvacea WC 439]|nr:hypothetical protein AX16_002242 [Volvariella volvacea WC 439]
MSTGRVALVTGANTGIGYELVRLLAEKGLTVYLASRTEKNGLAALEKLKAEGVQNVKYVPLDITNPASITAAKETLEKEVGRIDVLVNNAGIAKFEHPQNATTIDVAVVRDAVETNLIGLIQTTTTLLPLVRKSSQGVIVNVTTDMASNTLQAGPKAKMHAVAYNTSKAAANSYTIALAAELKAEGIKVNCVTPGFTSTQLNFFGKGGKTTEDGAKVILPYALLDKDGPTGTLCSSICSLILLTVFVSGLFIDEFGNESPW